MMSQWSNEKPMAFDILQSILHERKALRQVLARAYSCFTHETARCNLDSIRATGLQPRKPGPKTDTFIISLNVPFSAMLCLHPHGSTLGVRSAQHGPFLLLAIKSEDLPDEVTLDWSFPPCWAYAHGLEGTFQDIFLKAVHWSGAIAALGSISPRQLHVLCKQTRADSLQWRPLTSVPDDEIYVYSAALRPSPPSLIAPNNPTDDVVS